jgi:hypothetical protein
MPRSVTIPPAHASARAPVRSDQLIGTVKELRLRLGFGFGTRRRKRRGDRCRRRRRHGNRFFHGGTRRARGYVSLQRRQVVHEDVEPPLEHRDPIFEVAAGRVHAWKRSRGGRPLLDRPPEEPEQDACAEDDEPDHRLQHGDHPNERNQPQPARVAVAPGDQHAGAYKPEEKEEEAFAVAVGADKKPPHEPKEAHDDVDGEGEREVEAAQLSEA